ncbi:MAG: hypothetical protein IJ038_02805 [Clostridia bacterium]|nr:hypothetical protein [Clostridia bacterium]
MLDRETITLAAKQGIPVLYDDRERGFSLVGQITSIIESYPDGKEVLSAEVRDMRAGCVYKCKPEYLSLWRGVTDGVYGGA